MTIASETFQEPQGAVLQKLRRLIRTGALGAGERLPSERQLALKYGLARSAIRGAFSELEREGLIHGGAKRVRRVAETVTAANRPRLHRTIGILVPEALAGDVFYMQPGWPSFVQIAAASAVQQRSMQSLAMVAVGPDDEGLEQWLEVPPAGVVITVDCVSAASGQQIARRLLDAGIATVVHGDNVDSFTGFDCVCTDHYAGGRKLAEYLLGRGRRRILRVHRSPDRRPHTDRRHQAFEDVHRAAGIEPLPVLRTPHLVPNDNSSTTQNFELISRLLMSYLYEQFNSEGGIDALVAPTDRIAYELGVACQKLGKTPGRDVLIVGYDNSWAEAPERAMGAPPPTATIDKHHDQIGRALIELLMDRLDGKLAAEPQKRVIEPTLVEITPDT